MIRFVEGQGDLEQARTLIDGVDQADLPDQGVGGANTAMCEAAAALANLI